MKNYNFEKAKNLIKENEVNLQSASLGMHEDWFWTAETIWENGKFKRSLPKNGDKLQEKFIEARKNGLSMFLKEKNELGLSKPNPEYEKFTKHHIGGIYGSDWATPTLQLIFNDGTDKMIPCYCGEFDEVKRSVPIELGVLSGPVQENITPLTE